MRARHRARLLVLLFVACAACKQRVTAHENAGTIASTSASALVPAPDTSATRPWVELYYPGWAVATAPPDRIDWSHATDVVLFGIVPHRGEVEATASAFTTERLAKAIMAARAAKLNVLVCLGGEKTGAAFRASFDEPDGEAKLAASVASFVEVHALDGIVLDIEPLTDVPTTKLVGFVRALRERGVKRVEAVVAPESSEIDRLASIAALLDRVALMSYLRPTTADEELGLVEKLRAAGIPRDRIGVGLDARSSASERQRRRGAPGLILWHAGSLCVRGDGGAPCQPVPL